MHLLRRILGTALVLLLACLVSPVIVNASGTPGTAAITANGTEHAVNSNGGSPGPAVFSLTGSLDTARFYHTATLLGNGTVLITGGYGTSAASYVIALSSAELYNPSTGTFAATGSMATARYFQTATLLSNGMVLIAGGYGSSGVLSSAELYNPSTGTFTATGSMTTARDSHTATQLSNGMVLIAGGYNGYGYLSGTELYNPSTGTFTATGNMTTQRYLQTATLLSSGMVLLAGGYGSSGVLSSAELYNPSTGTFTITGSLNTARYYATATLLDNGMALLAGGYGSSGVLSSAELYNPSTGTFTATASLNQARYSHTATLLNDGTVLIAGGYGGSGLLFTAELYQLSTPTGGAPGTGSATVNGTEQSTIAGAPGTGSVTIYGSEQSVPSGCDDSGNCTSVEYDAGTVSLTVNGVTVTAYYGQNDDPGTVAASLAAAVNASSSIPVTATVTYSSATSYNSAVTLTAKTPGTATNYSLSASSASGYPTDFPSASFYPSVSGAHLAGGTNTANTTWYDYGTVWLTINGFQVSVSYGQGSTASSLVSAIASQFSGSGSSVTASVSGSTITLTANWPFATTNYSVSCGSSTSQPTLFSQPSFTLACPTALSGAATGGLTYDTGTILITVNGIQVSVSYGQGSTAISVASALANAINASGVPVTVSVSGPVITLTANSSGWGTNYSLSCNSTSSQPSVFSQPSFSLSCPASLTGGTDEPTITSLSPTYGPVGTSVTIRGTGFGTTQGSSTVTFNGVQATPTSWSSTSIVVPVPSTASSGNVVVTVSGTPSNSVNFTATLWMNAYGYRRSITVSHTKVPNTDQMSFPLLISGTYPYLATTVNNGNVINANGYDIVFTSDPDGTMPLPYERESYNPSSGQVIFWVQIPDLSHTTDTTIYMFYGNSAITTDQSRPSSVWDSNYQGVWHLPNGTELSAADSTINNNHGDIEGAIATAGEIGGGASFNGQWDYIVGNNTVNTSLVTVEAWVNLQSLPSSNALVAGFVNGLGDGTYDKDLIINSSGHAEFEVNSGGQKTTPATSALTTGTWAFLVGTADGSHANIYLNGSLAANVSAGYTAYSYTVPDIFIGGASSAYTYLKANIDEVRVSAIARSADWIATEYNNQSNPSAFYTIGSPISGGSGGIAASGIVSVSGSEQSVYWCQDNGGYSTSQGSTCDDGSSPQQIYDYGSVSVAVNGVMAGAFYGSNDTEQSVAASLVSAINTASGMPVSATVIDNNGDIELIAKEAGPAADYSVSCSASTDSSPPFYGSSFGAVCASSLTGGALIPNITSLSPTSGAIGTSVTITGTNFGSNQGNSTVTFSGMSAGTASSWNATSITVTVPNGATTGSVVVNVAGLTSNGVSFVTDASPAILGLSQTSGVAGTMITITGIDFGLSQGSSTVTFNGVAAVPQSWMSSSIAVPVPYGATSGNVVVTVSGVASNGISFSVISLSGSYAYNRAITIDHGNVAGANLTNFPVLISGTYPYLATTANGGNVTNSNGYDIIFTSDAAGTQVLPYERELYSGSTGQVIFWVQVPTLSYTTDTVIYIFYGNTSVTTDQSSKTRVWDGNYVGVWHLSNGSTLSTSDSTSNGNNGTNVGGATATTGQIDGGASFNGSSYITITPSGSLSGSYTIEEWAKPSQVGSTLGLFGSRTPHDDSFDARLNSTGVQGDLGTGSSWLTTSVNATFTYLANTWYHFAYVVTTTGYSIYVNGDLLQTGTFNGTPLLFDANHQLRFGGTGISGAGFKGSLDEPRVSKVARSAAWIATEFNNESNPSGFYSIGSGNTGAGLTLTSSPNASAYGTSVTFTATVYPSTATGTVTFQDGSTTLGAGTVSAGVATYVTSSLTPGLHSISAIYNSTDDYGTSTATLAQMVSLNLTATKTTLSPITSWLGYPVLVNVTVTGPGGTVPTVGGTIVCTATPPTGSTIVVNGTLSGNSTFAQILLSGLPLTPSGTSYSVTCSFASNNITEDSNSVSTPASGTVVNPPTASNTVTGQMISPRAGHQATLLNDGTVLVTGGTDKIFGQFASSSNVLASTEIYSSGSFASAAQMIEPRLHHTATLLSNSTGQVLITGGINGSSSSALATAELFTPGQTPGAPGTFSPTAIFDSSDGMFDGPTTQMVSPRYFHTATVLTNGQVLLAGGSNGSAVLDTAELYNPLTGEFTPTAPMTTARWMHTATLLTDGTVLIAGGNDGSGNMLASAEIYTPRTNQFTAVGGMLVARSMAQATLLGNGTVLISGGARCGQPEELPMSVVPSGCSLNESEIYSAGTFTATGSMNYSRYWHTATALPDGTVLIAGGLPYPDDGTQEIYNVTTGKYSLARNLLSPRFAHTATPLPSGVLLVGGYGLSGASSSNAEIYGSTWLSGGLYPKYMVLDIMYAPPGSGSAMTYSGQSSVGSNSSTTNSFQEQMMINVGFAEPKKVSGKLPAEFDYTYLASGTDAYALTTATTDTIAIPGPKYTGTCQPYQGNTPSTCPGWLGVDHESDIVWIWLNPEMDYTVATANSVVWNGYAANPADTNVAPGNMDIVPLTIAQLDGTAPIPPELMAILDRNWDPVPYGGVGGLTQSDLLTILQRDPFATNLSINGQPSTAPTNIPTIPTSAIPIYDPNIPSLDPVSGVCGGRYAFDPILGQTFPYSPLGKDNQANTLLYTLSSQAQSQWSKDTTDTYSVGLSASFSKIPAILNSLKSDKLTFTNESNPSTNNSPTNAQTLSIMSPLPTDSYSGPTQMQVWRDDLYGTYMFYPKPNDTTVNLQSSWAQSANTATITATIAPDPTVFKTAGALPTGSVTFYDGCTQLGTQPVTSGTATLNYAWSTNGTHEIRALYSGDTNYFHNVGNTLSLNVTSSALPYISSISPSTGVIGTQVTLNGANFDVSGTVTFNGIPATNTTWVSSTSVQAVVPLGATSGPVTITTYGTASNNVLFTVTQPTAAATTTTLVLTPTTSWTGYSVTANTLVTAGGGTVPAGTVNCISSPSTAGASNTPGTVNPNTGVAQVAITDLPVLVGSSVSASYTETCTFTPSNSALFTSSQSNPISGTVIPVPAATSSNTGGLNVPRENQQATLLNDGTVLITGGDAGKYAGWREDGPFVNILQSSEIYVNGSYVLGAEMTTARTLHQATLLSNSTGQVLITGGTNWNQISGEPLASAELFTPGQVPGSPGTFAPTTLYDPAAQAFTTTVTAMNTPRFWHTATLLPNGKVLIAGGTSTIGLYSSCPHNEDGNQNDLDNCSYMVTARQNGTSGSSLSTAELYDPLTGKFTYTSGPMIAARSRHTATLLLDGTVLITGGIDNNGNAIDTAEIYNPATDTFQATNGVMLGGRIRAAATRLGDGTVLITGGSHGAEYDRSCPGIRGNSDCPRIDAEIYDPVTGFFSNSIPSTGKQIGNMHAARYSHTSTLLSNGTVLIAGGRTTFSSFNDFDTAPTELYDPSTGQFNKIASMLNYRYDHTATSMPTGGVLLVGGAEGISIGGCTLGFVGGGCDNTEATSELYSLPIQSAGVHPKFMVLNVMYAPPGSGSSVTYTNQTQIGVGTTATQTKSNALTLSLSGTIGIAKIGVNGNYTDAQSTTNTYSVNTTTTDAITVPGSSSSTLGVDHEADVIWVWLNPESDFSLTTPSTLVWNGYATNHNDPNVALGMMDIVALTVGQLDGSTPIPPDLRELLDRNWDTISSGGAGPITNSDLQTILQRDPFAVNLTGSGAAAAPTNTPIAYSANYPVVDPNIPTHDVNNPDPTQCGLRYSFNSATGNTFQYAALGSTNQAFSQTYSLQSNTTTSSKNTASDTYFVDLAVGACFGAACQGNPAAGALPGGDSGAGGITVAFGDKYSWGETSGTTNNGQSMVTQALTINNPLPSDNYGGPVQMQVWTDNIFGTYMFYPKPTDTTVSLTSSQASTNTGDLVTFTATVTPDPSLASSDNGTIVPTGNVTFYDGCNVIGSPQLTNGVAMVSTSWSTVSSHTIQAVYSGDTTYFHNDAPALTQTVSNNASIPYINVGGITPASGSANTVVNIYGMNFGSSGVVIFNGVPATASYWSPGEITVAVPAGATTGPVIVTSNGYSSNGVLFTVNIAPATTITTLMLSPVVSWSGQPVDAHVTVTGPAGASIQGTVSCSLGTSSTPSVKINTATSSADVLLQGLPTVASGATTTATYTASCAFVSGNSNYAGSQSNPATGRVTNSPAATNTPTTGLNVARENHQANLLQNGTVLITGGDDTHGDALSSTEILVGNSFSLAAPMSVVRTQHQATLLSKSTGQVLVTGGWDDNGNVYSTAELFTPGPVPGDPGSFNSTTLYDPTAQAFTSTVTSMNVARYRHTATQLTSGKVLITGGLDSNSSTLNSAELFDPTTGIFIYTTGTLQTPRSGHNATLLTDGTVLITGGTDAWGNALDVAEIFNPATGLFTVTTTTNASKTQTFMTAGRSGEQAVLLGGGMVLITGGQDSYGNLLNSAELYSPTTGTFTSTQDTNGTTYMNAARSEHTATMLPDGTVLIAAGVGSGAALSSEEIYNPATGDFSLAASGMLTPRSSHTATEMPNGSVLLAGGVNNGSAVQAAEILSTSIARGVLLPKFMVLDVLYAPPGAGSTMTYTGATTVGTSTSTDSTFANAHSETAGATFNVGGSISVGIDVMWGHTFTQDGTSSFAFNTTTTNTIVVPGAVGANPAATTKISTGVDHEADIIRVWLNPATIYTLTPSSSNTIIWNGFATNPNDPNVAVGAMDIVSLTVSQLDGTSPIPPELQAALDRNWDSVASGGAGGLQPSDFKTILQRDSFATNTSLNGSLAFANDPTSYFDPNIPVPDPYNNNQCSTRYSFDPVLGQTFAFGQLGSTNQPFTQNYSLLTTISNVNQNTTTDQYSVDRTDSLTIGPIPILPGVTLSLDFANSNQATWTNTLSSMKTNTSAITQALSIKNPAPSDNYTGPTQMQVWQDKIYGTFMFYPVPTDTNIVLTSSQSIAGPGDTILLTAAITADPRIASSTNPPLVPTGTVNFYDGCMLLGSAQINSATGVASLILPSLAVGSHSILASYSGDSHFLHNVSEPFAETVANGTVAVPYISGLSPTSGSVGSTVVVSGVNFGSSGTVTFNGVTANTTVWTATSITVTVPGSATTGAVIVTSGGIASNGIRYTVNQPPGDTSTSVALSPVTSLSGYPVAANVTVTSAVNTIPSGAVSCAVASSSSAGTPFTANLNAAGTAEVMITSDLPIVPSNATPVPFTVSCSFMGNTGFANSQSIPVTGTVDPVPNAVGSAVGSLNTPRENHQATLLQDGTVLITGGDNGYGALDSSEIYINGNSNVASTMTMPRKGHQQTLLSNSTGQVLITGGSDGSSALASAELFTPGEEPGMPGSFQSTTLYNTEAQTYTNTPTTMTTARYKHTATQLTTGKVLIVGGSDQSGNALASAELYDPTKDQTEGTFIRTKGSLHFARVGHSATLLLDGTVLIAGGTDQHGQPLESAEIYNPLTNAFTLTQGSMNVGRVNGQATMLGNGQVLISGGQDGFGNSHTSAEIYDPKTGAFQFTQTPSGVQTSMTTARSGHSANLLNDGTVLIAGGQDTATDTLSTIEIYNPVTGTFSTAGIALQVPRHNHTATVLPSAGVLIVGGTNTTAYGGTTEANAELYSPFTLRAGLHPKFMVVNIQYAPPGAGPTETSVRGSTMTYANATTVGTSTTTENSFETQEKVSWSWGVNLGIVKYSHTVTETWTDTQDSSDTFSLSSGTTNSDVVPGPNSSSLGVDHESDVIWIWLNPVANYTITSPNTFVWNGFAADPNDPNSQNGAMDVIPLSVSQLDGTSTITQAEWDILDRNWDPIALGGAGPITTADFLTILGRDPFATNLSGVGRATAPTTAPTGSQYVLFDPNVATFDSVSGRCGNRYDFSPGFNMTFPFTQLGDSNQQAITQTYQLATTTAQISSTTTADTYKVALSSNLSSQVSATAKNTLLRSLKRSDYLQWTNTWTNKKNNSTLQTQTLTIKSPLTSDNYTGPEQMQVWMDNLYGTYMFYPKPSDTNWILMSSQNAVTSGNSVTLTVVVTADPHVPFIPSGTVTFYDGCTNLGSGTVDSATGTVSVTAPLSGSGQHTIVAIYSGDTHFFHNNSNSVAVTVQ